MKILQVKIEYDNVQEYNDDSEKKYSESFTESTITAKKDGKIIIVWVK